MHHIFIATVKLQGHFDTCCGPRAFDLPLKNFDQVRKKLCTKDQSHEYHSDCMKSISEPITVWIVLKSQIRAMCSMHLEGLSTEESAFSFFLRINAKKNQLLIE